MQPVDHRYQQPVKTTHLSSTSGLRRSIRASEVPQTTSPPVNNIWPNRSGKGGGLAPPLIWVGGQVPVGPTEKSEMFCEPQPNMMAAPVYWIFALIGCFFPPHTHTQVALKPGTNTHLWIFHCFRLRHFFFFGCFG